MSWKDARPGMAMKLGILGTGRSALTSVFKPQGTP